MAFIDAKNSTGTTVVNLPKDRRIQRKYLITYAQWTVGGTTYTEKLGVRTEDSSIEFNADISTSTDIRGFTYTDVNKTEPQQDFDPFYLLGESNLGEYLVKNALANKYNNYNGIFDVYIIAAFIDGKEATSGTQYYAVKHEGCSIIPTSLGGDSYNNMPIEVHYSNKITEGTVDKLTNGFTFTSLYG